MNNGTEEIRARCVEHPEDHPMLMIRRWQIEACDENFYAAALLGHLEYWHNKKLDMVKKTRVGMSPAQSKAASLYQFHSEEELSRNLFGLCSAPILRKAIQLLEEKGFVSVHKNPSPRYSFDRTRHFLFHPETVNAWLNKNYPKDAEGKRPQQRKFVLPRR